MKKFQCIFLVLSGIVITGCGANFTDEEIHQAAENVTTSLEQTSEKMANNYLTNKDGTLLKEGGQLVGSLLKGEKIDLSTTVDTALDLLDETSTFVIPNELVSLHGTCETTKDGDTWVIRLSDNRTLETVRAFSINTPESVGKYAEHPMPFGKEASNYAKKLLEGQQVELLVTPNYDRDKYGRLLAFVTVHGQSVQGLLLKEGLAMMAYAEPRTPFYDELMNLQNQAKKAKKGIWSLKNYATPSGYNLDAVK